MEECDDSTDFDIDFIFKVNGVRTAGQSIEPHAIPLQSCENNTRGRSVTYVNCTSSCTEMGMLNFTCVARGAEDSCNYVLYNHSINGYTLIETESSSCKLWGQGYSNSQSAF